MHSHTQALYRHSDKTAIDMQVCFYKRLFGDSVKSQRTKTDPVGPLRGINGVVWGPILFHCTSAWFMVRGQGRRLLWTSVWPAGHTTWLAVSTGSVNPPTHPPYMRHS